MRDILQHVAPDVQVSCHLVWGSKPVGGSESGFVFVQGLLMSATLSPEVQKLKELMLHSAVTLKLEASFFFFFVSVCSGSHAIVSYLAIANPGCAKREQVSAVFARML